MRAHSLLVLITSFTIAFGQTSHSTRPDFSAIRGQLRAHVGSNDVPGLAIAVSRGGEVLWEEGFGWADRERHVQATPATPFYIASVTKSITATAVLHLAERGRLQLDDPVNKYLGATKVHSPVWNSSNATIRRVEIDHFGLWHDKAGNAVNSPLAGVTDPETGLTFPNLNNPATELTQTNKILPEPCNFISKSLPRCSVIRPTSTRNGGAVATVKAFTEDGLFIGQPDEFLELSMDLAVAADSVRRGF